MNELNFTYLMIDGQGYFSYLKDVHEGIQKYRICTMFYSQLRIKFINDTYCYSYYGQFYSYKDEELDIINIGSNCD